MKLYIVALPLFDAAMSVAAYRLCDRSAETVLDVRAGHSRMSEAFSSPGLDLIQKVGPEPFAGDKPLFAEINRVQLLTGAPLGMHIEPQKLVCMLPAGMPADADILDRCAALKEQGYPIALDDFPLGGIQSPFFEYADYLLLDYQNPRFPVTFRAVTFQLKHVKVVITGIPDMASFQKLCGTRNALFSGSFYNQPITAGISEISPVKVNALQLLKQVNEPDFDLTDIAKIIERDPALSISLLRFINSGAGLPRKVASIQNAVAILGQQEVKRWATVAISVSLAEDRPGEITKLSLVRAKFAENLAGAFELGVFQQSLFMAGLFSLLDVILQKPMAEAINDVAVDDRVRKALVDHTGELYPVMELIYTYEHADWDSVSRMLIQRNIDADVLNKAFVDALVWYEQLLSSIDDQSPN